MKTCLDFMKPDSLWEVDPNFYTYLPAELAIEHNALLSTLMLDIFKHRHFRSPAQPFDWNSSLFTLAQNCRLLHGVVLFMICATVRDTIRICGRWRNLSVAQQSSSCPFGYSMLNWTLLPGWQALEVNQFLQSHAALLFFSFPYGAMLMLQLVSWLGPCNTGKIKHSFWTRTCNIFLWNCWRVQLV